MLWHLSHLSESFPLPHSGSMPPVHPHCPPLAGTTGPHKALNREQRCTARLSIWVFSTKKQEIKNFVYRITSLYSHLAPPPMCSWIGQVGFLILLLFLLIHIIILPVLHALLPLMEPVPPPTPLVPKA